MLEVIAYIGIGSNLGDREKNIKKAISLLKKDKKIRLIRRSRIYETEPLGGPPQGKFLNGVVKIKTEYPPLELLDRLKRIECLLGRRKGAIKWAPRTIDLDILLYGKCVIKNEDLTIPHPEIKKRLFVLKPLSEISPLFRHPLLKKTISQLLKKYEAG